MLEPEEIARICYESNRALQAVLQDPTNGVSVPWEDASYETREGLINAVRQHIVSDVDPRDSHDLWCKAKLAAGWVYGEFKDEEAKTHPCLKPYSQLSSGDKAKDRLFIAIIRALH